MNMEWLKRLFSEKLIRRYATSAARHLITALAGILGSMGLIEAQSAANGISDQLITIVVAVVMYAVAQLWSWKDKRESEPKIEA